eukprot:TRINITY_DN26444_c0_g2_i1.p1 TRINITY_DN26444_c0_g2~~TRINITY_DN26444_c0_g2_i1.p1  ORF type:complete len:628 (-),score=97.39 TRINITY_DN26444_c0_g2_i1:79-1962(-)
MAPPVALGDGGGSPRQRRRRRVLGFVLLGLLVVALVAQSGSLLRRRSPDPVPTRGMLSAGSVGARREVDASAAVARGDYVEVPQAAAAAASLLAGAASAGFGSFPNKTSVAIGPVVLEAAAKGVNHWKLAAKENDHKPALVVAKSPSGDPATFALDFDSNDSALVLPKALRRIAVSAAGSAADPGELDWTLDVEGTGGRHVSATSDAGALIYDASVGMEIPVKQGVSVRYAADMKRRSSPEGPKFKPFTSDFDLDALRPDWIRQGAGVLRTRQQDETELRILSPAGETSNDFPDMEVEYRRKLGRWGRFAPGYSLGAAFRSGKMRYHAKLETVSPWRGLRGALQVDVKDGVPTLSGSGNVAVSRSVLPGLDLKAGTAAGVRVPADGNAKAHSQLRPVSLAATADLSRLAPAIAGRGSRAEAHAVYEVGESAPSTWGASVMLNPTSSRLGGRSHLGTQIKAAIDSKDGASAGVGVRGRVGSFDVTYEADTRERRQFGEVRYRQPDRLRQVAEAIGKMSLPVPVDFHSVERVGGSMFARFTRSPSDHGGKPRFQFGLAVGGDGPRAASVQGESVLFDSGRDSGSLLDAGGSPLHVDSEHKAARVKAETLRRRLSSVDPSGKGEAWLRGH